MYVRLAFAVAAHLDSEILIVDEVLAVGDAEFQAKCLGKMKDVSTNQGRTVLFVSHNMSAIQKLCSKGMLLSKGLVIANGVINSVLNTYMDEGEKGFSEYAFNGNNNSNKIAFVKKIRIEDLNGKSTTEIPIGKSWIVKVFFKVTAPIKNLVVGLGMINNLETPVRTSWNLPQDFSPGDYIASFEENQIFFSSGRYRLLVGLSVKGLSIQYLDDNIYISISDVVENIGDSVIRSDNGILLNQMKMHVEKDNSQN
jgi:ABC-type glutathione transport system ATPase component